MRSRAPEHLTSINGSTMNKQNISADGPACTNTNSGSCSSFKHQHLQRKQHKKSSFWNANGHGTQSQATPMMIIQPECNELLLRDGVLIDRVQHNIEISSSSNKSAIAMMLLLILLPTSLSAFTTPLSYHHNRECITVIQKYRRYNNRPPSTFIFSSTPFDNEEEEEEDALPPIIDILQDDDNDAIQSSYSDEELQSTLTVSQLKQQLRLRGMKVGGTKKELIQRLFVGDGDGGTRSNSGSGNVSEGGTVDNELQNSGYTKYEKSYASINRNIQDDDDDDDEGINVDDSSSKKEKQSTSNMNGEQQTNDSKRVIEAKSRGADIVDVTNYIDAEEIGKSFKSSDASSHDTATQSDVVDVNVNEDEDDTEPKINTSEESTPTSTSSSPEVWGEDAKIIDDYEGRSVVVDGLSRTVIEYRGCNDTLVQAYVVGSRDALQKFLQGGQQTSTDAGNDDSTKSKKRTYNSMEEEVYAIQKKREKVPNQQAIIQDEMEGADADPSDTTASSLYGSIERDEGDWGVYTPTGAQLSSTEVQGVLFLSDVYGPFTDNTQSLVDKIAFECQPVVIMVPDLFRGDPWSDDTDKAKYEDWRSKHPDWRVDIDIRAAASVLRERYAISSIAVWGTCYGGGRALEAAAGWYPGGPASYYEDSYNSKVQNRRPPPPHVDPVAAIAWYPTRYNAKDLFGRANEGFRTFDNGQDRKVALMAVFAGNDELPGATPEDAMLLQECLEEDPRIVDYMVKIFPDTDHGFAHNLGTAGGESGNKNEEEDDEMSRFLGEEFGSMEPLAMGSGGDAEVACLLSTAWMETYSRVFLPTVGTPVKFDTNERWSSNLEMEGLSSKRERREVRSELNEAITDYEDLDIDMRRMSQSASPLLEEGPGIERFEQIEEERERIRQQILEKYNISDDDDEDTFDKKVQQAREDGALDGLLLDANLNDSGDAYW